MDRFEKGVSAFLLFVVCLVLFILGLIGWAVVELVLWITSK